PERARDGGAPNPVRSCAALRRASAGGPAELRADRAERPGGGPDLRAAGWDSTGDRAGGSASATLDGRADRSAVGRSFPSPDRRESDGVAPSADPPGIDRLELSAPFARRASSPAPTGGVRRRLDVRGGRGGGRWGGSRGSGRARSAGS